MRALVTGADGFIGSHLVSALLAERWEVVASYRGERRRLPEHPDIWLLRADLCHLPLRSAPPVDVVFSLAALADPVRALAYPEASYVNDVRIMLHTLDYAAEVGARVIHLSTNEAHVPRGAYAGGKACQEIICRAQAAVDVAIVTTQSVFGERQQADKLIPRAVGYLLDGQPVPVQRADDGTWSSRPWIHAGSVADGLIHTARDEYGAPVHTNVTSGYSIPNDELVRLVAQAIGCEPKIRPVPVGDRPGHDTNPEALVPNAPGWRPPDTLHTASAIWNTSRWYAANREWLCATT